MRHASRRLLAAATALLLFGATLVGASTATAASMNGVTVTHTNPSAAATDALTFSFVRSGSCEVINGYARSYIYPTGEDWNNAAPENVPIDLSAPDVASPATIPAIGVGNSIRMWVYVQLDCDGEWYEDEVFFDAPGPSYTIDAAANPATPNPFQDVVLTTTFPWMSDAECQDAPPTVSWTSSLVLDSVDGPPVTDSGTLSSPQVSGANAVWTHTWPAFGEAGTLTYTVTASGGCVAPATPSKTVTVSTLEVQSYVYGYALRATPGASQWGDITRIAGVTVDLMDVAAGPNGTPVATDVTDAPNGNYVLWAPLESSADYATQYRLRFTYPNGGPVLYWDASASPWQASTQSWALASYEGVMQWGNSAYSAYRAAPPVPAIDLSLDEVGSFSEPNPYERFTFDVDVTGLGELSCSGDLPVVTWESAFTPQTAFPIDVTNAGTLTGGSLAGGTASWGYAQPALGSFGTYSFTVTATGGCLGESELTDTLSFPMSAVPDGWEPPADPEETDPDDASEDLELELDLEIGQQVEGSSATGTATGLQDGADYDLVVRSTPQTLAVGTVPTGGTVTRTVTLPKLEPGWHSLTFTSTWAASGGPAIARVWFQVGASGTLLAVSSTAPALASTGSEPGALPFLGTLAITAGLALLVVRQRRASGPLAEPLF